MANASIYAAVVVVCTHNPQISKLREVISSILSNDSNLFRLVVIDNSSNNSDEIRKLCIDNITYIYEARKGNSYARFKAIREVRPNELLIFVDDDNYISPDYVATALRAVRENPHWGCFGGRTFPAKELRYQGWKLDLLPYVGIVNKGDEPSECPATPTWNPLEPIGAGICVRPEVCGEFLESVSINPDAYFQLGRVGKSLLSGEDSYIARQAATRGLYFAYEPKLKLIHDIRHDRVKLIYLIKLLYSYGKTDVLLDLAMNSKPLYPYPRSRTEAFARFIWFAKRGRAGFVTGFRQLGQFSYARKKDSSLRVS